MTYPAPDVLPYDEWFDPDYKYNPLDSMPIATNDKVEPQDEEDVTIHEKMYRIATSKYNPFAVGGSESIHDFEGDSDNASSL
tara:strand:- start:395 stop:640 length:246 start_codon:yes stop_codon:yes gene_type:complete